jgi:hypothetical protein
MVVRFSSVRSRPLLQAGRSDALPEFSVLSCAFVLSRQLSVSRGVDVVCVAGLVVGCVCVSAPFCSGGEAQAFVRWLLLLSGGREGLKVSLDNAEHETPERNGLDSLVMCQVCCIVALICAPQAAGLPGEF